MVLLENISDIKTGYPLRGKAIPEPNGNLLLVQMKDVDPLEGVNWNTPIKINGKGRNNPETLVDGDILFVGRGSRFYAANVNNPPSNAVASPQFYVLRPNKNKSVKSYYLTWLLNSESAQKFFASRIEGSALPYVSRKTIAELPITLPDIQTQERIVNVYRCWKKERRLFEELIEERETLINNILVKSIARGAIT